MGEIARRLKEYREKAKENFKRIQQDEQEFEQKRVVESQLERIKGYKEKIEKEGSKKIEKQDELIKHKESESKKIVEAQLEKVEEYKEKVKEKIKEETKRAEKQSELNKYQEPERGRIAETQLERSVGQAATKIASDIEANCIISVVQERRDEFLKDEEGIIKVIVTIFRKINPHTYNRIEYATKVNKVAPGSIVPIKEVLMEAIKKKYIEKDDKVVCVQDESMGSGYKAFLFIFEVDKIFFNISTHQLAENLDPNVLETAINLALEIGKEGREGKSIGTAFVIGERGEILKFTKQLVINPFKTDGKEEHFITDPDLRDTIKEFSQLDGIFVIDERGAILTAGTYLDVDTFGITFKGLGSRHRACAAITKKTNAVAIVVSESGGIVRIFKEGKVVMKLP